ncbi:MAG: AAA family ATPase [Desulfurococcales archaeon]|nr:AAA family ATPase [Desulfurococcales archaeon]
MSANHVVSVNLGGVRGLEGEVRFSNGLNIILGPNNSGKTSILEALMISYIMNFENVGVGLQKIMVQQAARGSMKHALADIVGDKQAKPCITLNDKRRVCVSLSKEYKLVPGVSGLGEAVTLVFRSDSSCNVKIDISKTGIKVDIKGKCNEKPQSLGYLPTGILPYNFFDTLIGYIKRTDPGKLEDIVLELGNDKYIVDLGIDPWQEAVVIMRKYGNGKPLTFYSIGRGVQRAFIIMTLLNLFDISLIDEVESAMHPELLRYLGSYIAKRLKGDKQIIITSQSLEASTILASSILDPSDPTANRSILLERAREKCIEKHETYDNIFSIIIITRKDNKIKSLVKKGCDAIIYLAGTRDPRLSYRLME